MDVRLAPASAVPLPAGNYCRFNGARLERPSDLGPATSLTTYVHDSFRALVLNEHFSCVGARAAVRQNAYGFALYQRMGEPECAAALASDLDRFVDDAELRDRPLTTFVASFVAPVPTDESAFEAALWTTLQQLNASDVSAWAPARGTDPNDPQFSFSFRATGFFIVGLHAGSSRVSRRFAWPTIIFNPHAQFDRMKADGSYARFQRVIRAADVELQGSVNPMLSDFGERSEARQYSGRSVGDGWRCPFHPRQADSDRENDG